MSLISLHRIFSSEVKRCSFILAATPKILIVPSANIISKEFKDTSIKKPAPWPYETKKFTYFHAFWQSTVDRFDENTKVIVVDGNIGAGKSQLAKQLAETFDMRYIPEPTLDPLYTTSYGYDLRQLDDIVPPSFKSCDINTFYKNPYHPNVAKFQCHMYLFRLKNYLDGLAHLLNTGQGIVLERCVFSDRVFMEAMYKHGYVSKRVLNLYNEINTNTLEEVFRPHLIVYLDISPEVALERIKKRNNPVEVNSPVLTKEYLESIEYFYKQKYLANLEKHTEILVYDWSNYGDVEVVVDDIERIDFDRYSVYDAKLRDWRRPDDWTFAHYRRFYTNERKNIMNFSYVFRPEVTELFHPGEEVVEYRELMLKIPGETFAPGFNPDAGDNVWWKRSHKGYRHHEFFRWAYI